MSSLQGRLQVEGMGLRMKSVSSLHCWPTQLKARLFHSLSILVLVCGSAGLQAASGPVETSSVSLSLDDDVVSLRSLDDIVSDYSVVLSSAEKTGRDLLIKNELVVSGARSRRLWQWPRGAMEQKVFASLAAQLTGTILFECEGADCGRSNVWSTLVFSEALIYGPGRYQHYRVVRDELGDVHVLYVVRRGNRRVHALYERIAGAVGSSMDAADNAHVLAALASSGIARLDISPEPDGTLEAAASATLERIGGQLVGFGAGEIYAVCHLYRAGLARAVGGSRNERGARATEISTEETVTQLLAASERCALAAAESLQAGMAAATLDGIAEQSKNRQRPELITFKSFGVGPLQPVVGEFNRIELVVPSRLLR